MRPVEFFMLAIWAAVMGLSASSLSGLFFDSLAYVSVLLALVSSFRSFQREHLISRKG